MTTTLSEGVKVPDVGSVNWAGDLEVNWNLLNGALANLSGNVKLDRDNTWTGEQSFTLPIVGSITGTAAKAIADEDGNNIKSTYGKLAGDQTWTGINYYAQNINIKASSNIPANGYGAGVAFRDYQSNRLGYIQPHVTSDNNKTILFGSDTGYFEFNSNLVPYASSAITLGSLEGRWSAVYADSYYYGITAWGLDKANVWTGANTFSAGVLTTMVETSPGNTGLVIRSTDQTWESGARIFLYSNTQTGQTNGSIYVDVDHGDNGNTKTGLTLVPNAFHPMGGTVNTTYGVSLGTATYQWAKVYSEQYYYNGTAWGLDKENQWLVKQIIKQDTIDITTNPSAEKLGKSLYFYDGSRFWAQYIPVWGTDGSFRMELGLSNYTTSGGQGYWTVANRISKDFTTFDFYTSHYNANLGTSTNKWKTLNGINPGALSLPDVSKSVTVDIPVDWVTDGSAWNALNVSNMGDGWLSLTYRQCGANDYILARLGGTNALVYPSMLFPATLLEDSRYYIYALLPVTKAMGNIRLEIKLTSGSVVANHSFYPCLGNV